MVISDLFQAGENLKAQKTRTLLTALGIVFGVGSVIGMLAIGAGAREESLSFIEQLGVRNVLVSRRGSAEPRTVFRIRFPSRSAGDDNGPVQRLAVLQRDLGVEVGACGSRPTVAETLHR